MESYFEAEEIVEFEVPRPGGKRRDGAPSQPRPALGRRPWFALLRRARSLRRFALAMAGIVPGGEAYPVWHAATLRDRLAGIRGAPEGHGVLLYTSSVHGIGLRRPLQVVWLDGGGVVLGRSLLLPGRLARRPGATWAVELPVTVPVSAAPGDVVSCVQSSTPCPEPSSSAPRRSATSAMPPRA